MGNVPGYFFVFSLMLYLILILMVYLILIKASVYFFNSG